MNIYRSLLLILAGVSAAAAAQNTVITVDVNSASAKPVPRTIFGTFLEPIGDSINNGLWAQILENPSFEESLWSAGAIRTRLTRQPELARASELGLPLPWEPLFSSQGWRYEPRWHDAANSNRSLLIMALPAGETGVRQRVYLPAHRCLEYRGSLYVKTVSGPATIKISLRRHDRPEEKLSEISFDASGESWAKHEFSLSIPAHRLEHLEPADFVIALSGGQRALVDQASLVPADAVDGLDPEMVALARDMHTPLLRYGGNFTSGYHWRDGVGPLDQRPSMLNQSWQMPEYNQFGTDEFLQFCKLINAQPQIAVNMGSGTPQEAADWVRYVDGKWGHGGLFWELGNELWGDWQIGYPTLEEVPGRTSAFSQAIRAVDPQAQLIATGADPDHFDKWNAAQLSGASGAYSYLSTHFVVSPDVLKPNPTPDFVADASFALPIGLEQRLRLAAQQIDADPAARGKVHIAFTEWLFVGENRPAPNFTNMGGAIGTAGFLNMLMRNSDIVPVSDMTGLIWFGGIWKKMGQVYGTPAYWAFREYASADVAQSIPVKTDSETYDVHAGIRRIPEITGVPYLDVVAGLNLGGNKLTLFCVNRRRDREIHASVHVNGFSPRATAHARQLKADSIYAGNDESEPDAITPRDISVKLDSLVFPAASVTVIEVPRS